MKKRKYQKFTEAEVQTLIHLSKQGYNNDFIAQVLKKKPSQVAQKKFGLGVKQDLSQKTEPRVKRKGRWSAREILILNHMWYKKNRPVDEIVAELGRSEKSILSKIEQLDQKNSNGQPSVSGIWKYMCNKIGI